jgi:hypothetical protein
VNVTPVRGPTFRRVAALRVEQVGGVKRLKVLALLGAYADAGEPSPPARELLRRLGWPPTQSNMRRFDVLLARLQLDGWLAVERRPGQRNAYRVLPERA